MGEKHTHTHEWYNTKEAYTEVRSSSSRNLSKCLDALVPPTSCDVVDKCMFMEACLTRQSDNECYGKCGESAIV